MKVAETLPAKFSGKSSRISLGAHAEVTAPPPQPLYNSLHHSEFELEPQEGGLQVVHLSSFTLDILKEA